MGNIVMVAKTFPMYIAKFQNLLRLIRLTHDIPSLAQHELLDAQSQTYSLRLRTGQKISLRSHTTDIHELIAIASGRDYPHAVIAPQIQSLQTVIDIGAHIGTFVYFLDHSFDVSECQYHGFEPHPKTFRLLKHNLSQLPFAKKLLHQQAVSGRSGTMGFSQADNPNESHLATDGSLQISVQGLSAYINRYKIKHIDILKLDCEGEELAILSAYHHWDITQLIVLEYHTHTHKDMLQQLKKLFKNNHWKIIHHTQTPELHAGIVVVVPK